MVSSIICSYCRIPLGCRCLITDNHRTAPMSCTVLFISYPPLRVINGNSQMFVFYGFSCITTVG